MRNSEIYNIDNFIKKAKEMELSELNHFCQKELGELDGIKFTIKSPFKEFESEMKRYKKFIHEFSFILINGKRPLNMPKDDFTKTKIIIESLIEKKCFKIEILSIYDV